MIQIREVVEVNQENKKRIILCIIVFTIIIQATLNSSRKKKSMSPTGFNSTRK
jgi:hypothetical protein